MSFLTGTQSEVLYCQPANCTAVTAAAQTVLTGTPAASNPPYLLPAYFFASGQGGVGKAIHIAAGGFFSTGTAAVNMTLQLAFDTTAATFGTAVAKTGAFAAGTSVTNGAWFLDVFITCQQVGTTMNLNAVGSLDWGTGNNAATASAAGYMVGAPNTSIALANATAYFPELWATWSATTGAPTITCSQFLIEGLN